MRGKVYSFGNIKDQVGITPAYAGKSITEIFQKDVNKDHPRLCGEKQICKHFGAFRFRITPAYAGKRADL